MPPPLLAKVTFLLFSSPRHSRQLALPTTSLLRLSLSNQPQQSNEEMPFIAQYLVSSFGFSHDKALKVSTYSNLSAIKTQDRPESVVSFLQEIGFSDSQIRSLISSYPILLSLSIDKTLKPQVRALTDAGYTGEMLIQLILSNPQCLSLKGTLSRLQFWRNLVGYRDKILLRVIKNNNLLMTNDIDGYIMPRVNLLREYGLSDQQIVKLVTRQRGSLSQSVDSLKWVLEHTEKLGFERESNMFLHGLIFVGCLKKEKFKKKVSVFIEMCGWSEEEVYTAIRKAPSIFGISTENLMSKMDFLVNIAGIDPRTIASQPILLTYSLEGRLRPRHNILSALEAKGLIKKLSLRTLCTFSDETLLERYIVPYEKDAPELRDIYTAGCGAIEKAVG